MKKFITKGSLFHSVWMIVMVMLLCCTSLTAATKTQMKVLGTLMEKAQFNGNYDAGNKWWGYQTYTRSLNLDLSDYKDDMSNLVLTLKLYIPNFRNTII